jgi:hypothetical protein
MKDFWSMSQEEKVDYFRQGYDIGFPQFMCKDTDVECHSRVSALYQSWSDARDEGWRLRELDGYKVTRPMTWYLDHKEEL